MFSIARRRFAKRFRPDSIPNLVAWYDASDIASIVVDGSGNVSEWADKTANARKLTQSDTTARPSYGASNAIRDIPCPRFDGSNDVLVSGSFTITQPSTVFAVISYESTSNGPIVDSNNAANRMQLFVQDNNLRIYAGSFVNGAQALQINAPTCVSCVFNGAQSRLRPNRRDDTTGNAGTLQITSGIRLGAGADMLFKFQGMIAEVLWYESRLPIDQIVQVENYLSQKWKSP